MIKVDSTPDGYSRVADIRRGEVSDGGVFDRADDDETSAFDVEALAGSEYHVLVQAFLRDPELSADGIHRAAYGQVKRHGLAVPDVREAAVVVTHTTGIVHGMLLMHCDGRTIAPLESRHKRSLRSACMRERYA